MNRTRPEFKQVCGAALFGAAALFLNAVPYLSAENGKSADTALDLLPEYGILNPLSLKTGGILYV